MPPSCTVLRRLQHLAGALPLAQPASAPHYSSGGRQPPKKCDGRVVFGSHPLPADPAETHLPHMVNGGRFDYGYPMADKAPATEVKIVPVASADAFSADALVVVAAFGSGAGFSSTPWAFLALVF